MTVLGIVGVVLLLASCVIPLVLAVVVTVKRDWDWP